MADAVDVYWRGRVTPAAWREDCPSGRDLEPRHSGRDGLHLLRRVRELLRGLTEDRGRGSAVQWVASNVS
jgi:hypothetical protein